MKKIVIIILTTLTIIPLIHEIKSEDNLTDVEEVLAKMNATDDLREGKQGLGDIVAGVVAGVAGAISKTVVDGVLGNTVMSTGRICSSYGSGSRRSDRYCDIHCDDYYRGPVRGYCSSALNLCVCECDAIECSRYCRRYDDDYDYDYDYRYPDPRQRLRDRPYSGRSSGYCSDSGCRCD